MINKNKYDNVITFNYLSEEEENESKKNRHKSVVV